jgi:protein TonB
VGLVAATVVIGALAVVYLVFLGGEEAGESPQVAQTSAPTPVPPAGEAERVVDEPLPEPPPLEDRVSVVDLTAPVEVPSSAERAPTQAADPADTPARSLETVTAPAFGSTETPVAEATPKSAEAPVDPAAASSEPVEAAAVPVIRRAQTPPQDPLTAPATATKTETTGEAPPPQRVAPTADVEPEETETPEVEPAATEPVVVPPQVLQRVEPKYSAKAVKSVDNPVVALRVLVDQQGKIARVLVDEGIPGSELEGAAVSAVLRWRFRPATENGVPVKAWTTVRFVFED